MSEQKLQARVYSRTAPTEEQLAQLRELPLVRHVPQPVYLPPLLSLRLVRF